MSDYLASPVWGNASREITQPWGCTPLSVEPWWNLAECHWHCGVDVGLNTGTPLYAARAGQVVNTGYGLLAIQVGAQRDWYVHVDRAAVASGTWVTRGQLVAWSGAKVPAGGYLTGPHLHFEVQGGTLNVPPTSIDPIPTLSAGAYYSGAAGALTSGGFGTLTDIEIQNRFVAVLESIDKARQETRFVECGLFYAEDAPVLPDGLDPKPFAKLFGVKLRAAAATVSGVGVSPELAQEIKEAHDDVALILARPAPTALDLGPILSAIDDLKQHPSFDPADAATLAIVQKLERAAQAAGAAA